MKKIYFVRHGRTGGNEKGLWQTFDQKLSDHGREQATKVSKRFKDIKIEYIMASDMDRAFETAQIISAEIGLEVIPTKLLHEIHRPSVVRGRPKTDEETMAIMNEVEKNWGNDSWKHSDEENFFDLRNRTIKALEEIVSLPAKAVIAVTHEFVSRMIFGIIFYGENLSPESFSQMAKLLAVENTGVSEFQYTDGNWKMVSWNDHSHLLE
jgi:broad specificity phosphatase PhoE